MSAENEKRVVLYADESLLFYGKIFAKSINEKGGFVELSGKKHIAPFGVVDVS